MNVVFVCCPLMCSLKHVTVFAPESLGGVKNLQVTDPTTTTLNVRWDAAEGNVQQYKISYVPAEGGPEMLVRPSALTALWRSSLFHSCWPLALSVEEKGYTHFLLELRHIPTHFNSLLYHCHLIQAFFVSFRTKFLEPQHLLFLENCSRTRYTVLLWYLSTQRGRAWPRQNLERPVSRGIHCCMCIDW